MSSTIQLAVDEQTARAFAAASPDQQKRLRLLLRLRLKELTELPARSIDQVMDEIGATAAARGLTPEILESLLDAD
jgi:hypothetical protein